MDGYYGVAPTTLINALQVGMTITFLVFCMSILKWWGPSVKNAVAKIDGWNIKKAWRVWNDTDWLGMGIAVGFFAAVCDNTYWGITWALVEYQSPLANSMMHNGPVNNVFSRQFLGIIAAFCHLRGAHLILSIEHAMPWKKGVLLGIGTTFFILLTRGSPFSV